MLACVIVIASRAIFRLRSARRFAATNTDDLALRRSQRMFAADLSLSINSLKSIAYAAPFLGFVGTCIGILDSFTGLTMQKWLAFVTMISTLVRAPITAAAAVLVAVPAIWSYNHLRTLLDLLEAEMAADPLTALHGRKGRCIRIAQSLPLRGPFSSFPVFALMGVLCVSLAMTAVMIFPSFYTPRGLRVGVLGPAGRHEPGSPFLIQLFASKNGPPDLIVNDGSTGMDELASTVRSELSVHPQRMMYVQAERDVPWAEVVSVIDVLKGLGAKVVLLTNPPYILPPMRLRPALSLQRAVPLPDPGIFV